MKVQCEYKRIPALRQHISPRRLTSLNCFYLIVTVLLIFFAVLPAKATSLNNSQRLDAYVTLAESSIEKADFEQAMIYIDKALPLCSLGFEALRAELMLKKGYLQSLSNQHEEGLITLNELLSGEEKPAQAYLIRGDIYSKQGKIEIALEDFLTYTRLVPEDTQVLSSVGEFYMGLDQYEKALEIFDSYLEKEPVPSERVYYLRGISLIKTGGFEAAVSDFTKAAEDSQLKADALYNRGICYMQTGEFISAVDDFSLCIDMGFKIQGLYLNRGISYMSLSEYDSAVKDFTISIEADLFPQESLFNRGLCNLQAGKNVPAEEDFTLLIQSKGMNNALYYRGLSRMNQGKFDLAIEDSLAAEQAGLSTPWNLYNRAISYFAQEEYEAAIADHSVNIRDGELLALSYYNRSLCYRAQGKTTLAEEDLIASLAAEETEAQTSFSQTLPTDAAQLND